MAEVESSGSRASSLVEEALRPEKRKGFFQRHPRLAKSLRYTAVMVALSWVAWQLFAGLLIDLDRFDRTLDSVTVVDRNGVPLRYQRAAGMHRRWMNREEIPEAFEMAILAAEDRDYYAHDGVDWSATSRGAASLVLPFVTRSGGSTITQQTVKLVYGRPNGRWSKPLEILRAMSLEREMNKDDIFEQYVNRLPFANNIEGLYRAAESYLGKRPSELSLSECALLAGLPQAPSRLDPRRHLDAALSRRDVVIERLRRFGQISAAQARAARSERPRILRDARPWRAPRFVDRVLAERRQRGQGFGTTRTVATSLDAALQGQVQQAVAAQVRRLETRGVQNGAALVYDHHTGEVLAYVGAALGGDAPGASLDLLRARRQPGSTLKPFVYERLFEMGGDPSTLLADVQVPMTGRGEVMFQTQDYDGIERGPVRARDALAWSLNLAALDAARRVGAEELVARLAELGFTPGSAEEHGAAVALGGMDVTAIQLAEAYGALASNGEVRRLRFVVEGQDDAEEAETEESSPIFEPGARALIRDILFDGDARSAGFGSDLEHLSGRPFGLKTGTSSGHRDVWSVAFTEDVTVVVWFGDPSGLALDGVSGFEVAAPVAARIIRMADPDESAPRGMEPELESLQVCALSGALPDLACPLRRERFRSSDIPTHRCELHQPDGSVQLPPVFADWVARRASARVQVASRASRQGERLRIVSPRDGDTLMVDPERPPFIRLRATLGGAFANELRWTVDGQPVRGRWRPTPGEHRIEVSRGELRASASVEVEALPR